MRVPLEDACGYPLDRLAVGDVADLELAAELACERLEPLAAPGEQDAVASPRRERPRRRLADPARGAGDDGDARRRQRQTRTTRCASAFRPLASVTIARSRRAPFGVPAVRQTAV